MAQDCRNLFPILCRSLAGSTSHGDSETFIVPSDGSTIPQDPVSSLVSCQQAEDAWIDGGTGGATWPWTGSGEPHFCPYTHTSHWPEPTLKTTLIINRSSCVSRRKGKCLPVSITLLDTLLTSTFLKNPSPPFDKYTHSLFNKYFWCTPHERIHHRPGPHPHYIYSITRGYGAHKEKGILKRHIYK